MRDDRSATPPSTAGRARRMPRGQGCADRAAATPCAAFNDHLSRDAGMVDAWLPQRVPSVHAPISAQDILQCIVERVPHMQIAGDVRRRNHDAKRLRRRPFRAARPERSRLLPKRGGAALTAAKSKDLSIMEFCPAMPCRSVNSRSDGVFRAALKAPSAEIETPRGYKRIVTAEVNARSWRSRSPTFARAPLAQSPRAPIAQMAGRFSSSHC